MHGNNNRNKIKQKKHLWLYIYVYILYQSMVVYIHYSQINKWNHIMHNIATHILLVTVQSTFIYTVIKYSSAKCFKNKTWCKLRKRKPWFHPKALKYSSHIWITFSLTKTNVRHPQILSLTHIHKQIHIHLNMAEIQSIGSLMHHK